MPSTSRAPSAASPASRRPRDPRPEVPGYELGPPIGTGSHGPLWSATAGPGSAVVEAGRPCVVAVLTDTGGPGELAGRLAAVVGAPHPNVADVLDVVALPGGCAVVSDRLPGPNLAVLRVSRPGLAPGEIAALLSPLAQGLAHLHERGIVHGDVSPANVVLAHDGRPVLVDLAGGPALELGTPGFIAPERLAGAASEPAADVWSLAETMVWLAGSADRGSIRAALAPALEPLPGSRCTADDLADLASRLGPLRALDLPSAPALASGSLRALSAIERTTMLSATASRSRRGGAGPAGSAARSGRRARQRHRRHRMRVPVGSAVAAVVLVVLVLVGAGAVSRGPAPAARPDADGVAAPASATAARSILADIVAARDRALALGDARALAELTVPGSAAAKSDEAVSTVLDSGARAEGVVTGLVRVDVLDEGPTSLTARVVTRQGAHARRDASGAVEQVAAQPERCAVLVLELHAGRWRVRDVAPCPT